jgi:hypothetical protein
MNSSAARNEVNSPAVRCPCSNLAAAVPQRAGDRDPAEELHERRQQRQHARHLEVGAEQRPRDALEFRRFTRLGAERLDDAVPGEGLGRNVRDVLLRFLAPARDGADALAEPDQRVDDQRRRRHAQQRQLRVVVEEQAPPSRRAPAIRARDRRSFRHRALYQADVVVDARQSCPTARRAKNAAD